MLLVLLLLFLGHFSTPMLLLLVLSIHVCFAHLRICATRRSLVYLCSSNVSGTQDSDLGTQQYAQPFGGFGR